MFKLYHRSFQVYVCLLYRKDVRKSGGDGGEGGGGSAGYILLATVQKVKNLYFPCGKHTKGVCGVWGCGVWGVGCG